jgi:UDP-2-acetamido-3-amino-2,3-dideoxy-glucuronate N-acetyltransferase
MPIADTAFVHETSIVSPDAILESGVRVWQFCHIMPTAVVGEGSVIGQNVMIAPGTVLGKRCKVQNNVSVYTGVICEDDVFLGPSMVFTNVFNPRSFVERKNEFRKTLVKRGATIGANATIVCGVTINEFAFIGAGSVITKDVPAYALVYGNPGRQHGWMSEYGCSLNFVDGKAVCKDSGELYSIDASGNVKKSMDL